MNKYVDITAPWELAKKKSSRKSLSVVIYNLLEGLRIISGLIYPVMPDTAAKMQKHLGLDPETPFYLLDQLKTWKSIKPGTRLPKSIVLFPRVETAEKVADPWSNRKLPTNLQSNRRSRWRNSARLISGWQP